MVRQRKGKHAENRHDGIVAGDTQRIATEGAVLPSSASQQSLTSTASSGAEFGEFSHPPTIDGPDLLAESLLDFTLRRRRFVLLVGLGLGLVFQWVAGRRLGLLPAETAFPAPFRDLKESMNQTMRALDEIGLTKTFSAYIDQSKSAFRRARNELLDFAPADLKLLYQLHELMDFTKEAEHDAGAARERPGVMLASSGLRPKHPVVLVPGIVTTGLELWRGDECAKSYFRQRLWGTMSMIQSIMLNTRCWLKHMSLSPETGLDPPGIKVRAAQGFEAADYVVGGYWVWSKMIENLADVGYDPLSMHMAAYDWRLPAQLLEVRDGFLSGLASKVEQQVDALGEKAVIVAHSMGGNFMLYFFQWVAKHRGLLWVDEHVHALVMIASPALGVPKAVTAILSGEARDAAELGMLYMQYIYMCVSTALQFLLLV